MQYLESVNICPDVLKKSHRMEGNIACLYLFPFNPGKLDSFPPVLEKRTGGLVVVRVKQVVRSFIYLFPPLTRKNVQ